MTVLRCKIAIGILAVSRALNTLAGWIIPPDKRHDPGAAHRLWMKRRSEL